MNVPIAEVINTSIFKSIIIVSIPFCIITAILFFIQDKKIKDMEQNIWQILTEGGQILTEGLDIISKAIDIAENNIKFTLEEKMQTKITELNAKIDQLNSRNL